MSDPARHERGPGRPEAPFDDPRADPRSDGGGRDAAALQAEAVERERLGAEIERLTSELATARTEAGEHLDGLQRARAEFQNFRRRTTEEREREMGLASEWLLGKVLGIADDFDRAIEAVPEELKANPWTEGIAAIDRKLRGLLESEGVKLVEAMGRQFDPREHEAVANVPGTGRPDGEVVAEIRRGYRLRDKVLRPALVAVAENGETHVGRAAAPDAGIDMTNDTDDQRLH